MLHAVAIKLRRDKAHERNREQKRDVYRRFFFEWLPERMPAMSIEYEKEQQAKEIVQLRQQYLDEALEFFGKLSVYEEMHRPVVLAVNNTIAANLLRPIIAKHSAAPAKKLGELVRAFRRFVEFDEDGSPHVTQTPHTDEEGQLHRFLGTDAQRLKDEHATDEFIKDNWQRLKELERQRAKRLVTEGEL